MLVLTRNRGESLALFVAGEMITITMIQASPTKNAARLGITASQKVTIARTELLGPNGEFIRAHNPAGLADPEAMEDRSL